MNVRPRRSVLYMPGSNVRALEKAKTLSVDGVHSRPRGSRLRLKPRRMRAQKVTDAVKAGGFGKREVFIRVNSVSIRPGMPTTWPLRHTPRRMRSWFRKYRVRIPWN